MVVTVAVAEHMGVSVSVVGGNLALDFVNTQNGPAGGDPDGELLNDYNAILSWGRQLGVLSAQAAGRLSAAARRDPDGAGAAYQMARRVREDLYDVFIALAHAARPSDEALGSVQSHEARALQHAQLTGSRTGFRWDWGQCRDLEMPLWPIVHSATELLTTGPVKRVKGCAACRFVFLDQSKNGSRRWCSMDDCGKAQKMRRYVAGRAARRREVGPGPDQAG